MISLELAPAFFDMPSAPLPPGTVAAPVSLSSPPMSPFNRRDQVSRSSLGGGTLSASSSLRSPGLQSPPPAAAAAAQSSTGVPLASPSAPFTSPGFAARSSLPGPALHFDRSLDCWAAHGSSGIVVAEIAPDKGRVRVSVFALSPMTFIGTMHPDNVVIRPNMTEV